MGTHTEVLHVLAAVLSPNGRALAFIRDTPLLGADLELDSTAVASLITALEECLGVTVPDDQLDGSTFASVGSLVPFVEACA